MAKIEIKQGTLIGNKVKNENCFEYFEFLQIPYAQPPVGELRFKSPQPPKPWNGERDATTVNKKNIALQVNLINELEGCEDCLYLNVFTPRLGSIESNLLPVIVLIHGGGFVLGNGIIKETLGISSLIEQNVVCVCINYRLGAFGFLSLDIPEAAGNMGLKDQVAALKWINENISAFGGNKANVTLNGISAGSASVEYHILSPLSRGLFSKGILQSGSAFNHWAYQKEIKQLSLKLARNLGYRGSSSNMQEVHRYMVEQPAVAIIQKANEMEKQCKGAVNLMFVPSVEKDFGNGEAFLTRLPYELMKEGKFNRVPVIKGFAECEGSFTQSIKYEVISTLQENKDFAIFWKYPLNLPDIEVYNREFERQYFSGVLSGEDKKWRAIDFFSDFDFVSGIITSGKLMAHHGVPVYSYIYAFDEAISVLQHVFNIDRKKAGHCDDVCYTMDFKLPGFDFKFTEVDVLMKKRINKMWANFARTGNPTPDNNDDDLPLQWPTFTNDSPNFMVIDTTMKLRTEYEPERISLFEEIYEKYHE